MADLRSAVEKLDNREFKNVNVRCTADPQEERPRDRYRSRSPAPRGGRGYPPGPGGDDYYDRRPRGYSPRRDDSYRRRSPPRDYYESRDRGYGRPPSRGPPRGDYPPGPPRGRYDDAYGPPPPRQAPYEDPYTNGHGAHGRPYATSPRRRSPGRAPPVYEGGSYDRARYW
jgi:transcription initiation factor TFIID subunit 15